MAEQPPHTNSFLDLPAYVGKFPARPGKYWVYERILRIPYYGIFLIQSGELELYQLVGDRYQRLTPNQRGHYPIPAMRIEIGVWQELYENQTGPWLRWWDLQGHLLLTGSERARLAEARIEAAEERAAAAEERATQLAERLRAMGIDPDAP